MAEPCILCTCFHVHVSELTSSLHKPCSFNALGPLSWETSRQPRFERRCPYSSTKTSRSRRGSWGPTPRWQAPRKAWISAVPPHASWHSMPKYSFASSPPAQWPYLSYVLAPRMPVHLGCCGTTDPLARAALRHEVVLARALSFTLIDHVRVLKLPTARATASHSLQTFGLAFLGSLFGWLSHDIVMPHEDIANVEDDF